MSRLSLRLAVAIAGLLWSMSANAQQVITQCGPSKGYGFYLEPRQQGWVEDGIDAGSMTFLQDERGEIDIIIKHTMGTITVKGEGAKVAVTHRNPGRMTILAIYPVGTVETYQLTLNESGQGTLIWSSLKNAVPPLIVTRGAVYVSRCTK